MISRFFFGFVLLGLFVAWVGCDPNPEPNTEPSAELVQDGGISKDASAPVDQGVPKEEKAPDQAPPPEGGVVDVGPVKAEAGKWKWVDVSESKCGFGTPTGFALNPSPQSDAKRVLIYLQGGGACWDNKGLIGNCFSPQPSATNLTGYGQAQFSREGTLRAPFFSRTPDTNVFANDHMVFIPYCSGDVYAGNSKILSLDDEKTMYFNGHNNMKAFLARIVATFPNATEVVISGSSAGGFGASMNWWLVQKFFGDKVKVHLLNDSGHPFNAPDTRWKTWVGNWKIVFPEGCADCDQGIDQILIHYEKTLIANGHKMAFLTYHRDQVIRLFYGGDLGKAENFEAAVFKLFDKMDGFKNVHYFGLPGESHTMMGSYTSLSNASGVKLNLWIKAMMEDDASVWKSYRK